MASATVTANPESSVRRAQERAGAQRGRRSGFGSRLGRLILLLNLLGLAVLVAGVWAIGSSRQGLLKARLESLSLQGELIANVIDETATVGDPVPVLDADTAAGVLQSLFIPKAQRARLFDAAGRLLADSEVVADRVDTAPLPTPRARLLPDLFGPTREEAAARRARRLVAAHASLQHEVRAALAGSAVAGLRQDERGARVVSVSIPIRRVRAVLGVLTLEAGDVDSIVAAERSALAPFILVAVGVALISSLLLISNIAVPVLRLARAADRVRLSRARTMSLPDLSERRDELGDLARSLEAMTAALSERMTATERFAADVSHELRNPMTSIRSAVETLELVKTAAQRARLIAILQHDVGRLDRLITDISNASRLDAELARDPPAPMDLARLVGDICEFYQATSKPGDPPVRFFGPRRGEALMVVGREGPLGQVIRNLIDNARSFSPPGGEVRVSVSRAGEEILAKVEDDGPGVPPENLETVFQRFYTSRPKGTAFGSNSGLGLAIARQIVETHGGRVWAENRFAGGAICGASFRVALPAQ